MHIRDRSCLLLCSLLLKAREQYWHLYFLSGASEVFREAGVGDAAAAGSADTAGTLAPGILEDGLSRGGGGGGCCRTKVAKRQRYFGNGRTDYNDVVC